MDPVSGVASVFAVASLVLQLIQTVNTAKTFVRDVKGASKELERLAELLDRLSALLQDVRELMERQKSMVHFPVPSNIIFVCLKGCKKSLGLLDDVVEKYRKVPGISSSAVKRWKYNVKLALEAKDIELLETRIQRHISDLHAAYAINTANMLISVLPIMLLKQTNMMVPSSISDSAHQSIIVGHDVASDQILSLSQMATRNSTRSRTEWIESPLNRFGISQRQTSKFIRIRSSHHDSSGQDAEVLVSKHHETFFSWKILGYVCSWTRQYPYGSNLSSLQFHPMIETTWEQMALFYHSIMGDVNLLFRSGRLHPFTVSHSGLYTELAQP
ncbi:hypothetical protein HBH53_120310 [Parastagonospora nodorum]|nr:hypothetical protein HBH53_120310 [Parastagonospora nodorum]KAH4189926.1 hypothetical protein HBH42_137730 [Parastagonospora nodorum]KAH4850183.1 hypothetical protein HBH75_138030 [Parastagonospora nodorum]KAH4905470.1 hypothetical protein HBI80_093080 [Parastagonospora nodorum]KAH5209053.1 hypothetical protein HBH77_086630 [Parastagonospora nodorum]